MQGNKLITKIDYVQKVKIIKKSKSTHSI